MNDPHHVRFPDAVASATRTPEQVQIEHGIVEALRTVFDPEIPVNIYELGLIYDIDVAPSGDTTIRMTLTSPNCPAAASLPAEVETKTAGVPGVAGAKVEIVWEPPWNPEMMTEAAKLDLGML